MTPSTRDASPPPPFLPDQKYDSVRRIGYEGSPTKGWCGAMKVMITAFVLAALCQVRSQPTGTYAGECTVETCGG